MTSTTAPAFRFLGTTDDTTECAKCGREELRSTVVLDVLDADGNSEGVTYYGSTCAARVLTAATGRKITGPRVLAEAVAARTATLQAAANAEQLLAHYADAEGDDDELIRRYAAAHSSAMWARTMTPAGWLDKARAMFTRQRAILADAAALRPAA